MSNKNINELLIVIEDSDEDFFIIERVINNSKNKIPIIHYNTGEKAIENLKQQPDDFFEHRLIILLDLNLPGISGHEVIEYIRQFDKTKLFPIIILSSSASTKDINKSYKYGANSFLKKNMQYEKFSQDILEIKNYWFTKNLLPCPDDYQTYDYIIHRS